MAAPLDSSRHRTVGIYDRPAFWQHRRFWIVAAVTLVSCAVTLYFFLR
jgi:hypothetical protein